MRIIFASDNFQQMFYVNAFLFKYVSKLYGNRPFSGELFTCSVGIQARLGLDLWSSVTSKYTNWIVILTPVSLFPNGVSPHRLTAKL